MASRFSGSDPVSSVMTAASRSRRHLRARSVLERAVIDRQIEMYRTLDATGRRSIVGLQPKRADVILAGACIVRKAMDKLGVDRLTVSDRGLRHGLKRAIRQRRAVILPRRRTTVTRMSARRGLSPR